MAIEIERKFLLASDAWKREAGPGTQMIQGYLASDGATVRVRIAGEAAYLTIKGNARDLVRSEFEYPIPMADAKAMLEELSVSPPVAKCRYRIPAGNGLCWEIDEYFGANAPLVTAEIELPAADTPFERPAWLGPEVSGDRRYTNRSLSRNPYSAWPKPEEA